MMTKDTIVIPTVPLKYCDYHKPSKRLIVSSEYFAGSFPRDFFVESEKTGKVVRFVKIGPEDKLFNEDQWDGEQSIYRPMGDVPTVDHLVVVHHY